MRYILVAIIVLFLFSCGTSDKSKIIADILGKNDSLPTSFTINPTESHILHNGKGIAILIPKGSLVYEDGSIVSESVKITLETYKDLSDMISGSLQTIADDRLLISDGMFCIEGKTVSGKKIKIGNSLKVISSIDKQNADILLFKGEEANDKINWTAAQKQAQTGVVIPFEIMHLSEKELNRGSVDISSWVSQFFYNECRENPDSCPFDLIKSQNTFIGTKAFWERYRGMYNLRSHFIFGRDKLSVNYSIDQGNINNIDARIFDVVQPFNSIFEVVDLYSSVEPYKVDSIILIKIKALYDFLRQEEIAKKIKLFIIKDIEKQDVRIGRKYTPEEKESMLKGRYGYYTKFLDELKEDIVKYQIFKKQRLLQPNKAFFVAVNEERLKELQEAFLDRNRKFAFFKNLSEGGYSYLATLSTSISFDIKSFGWYNVDRYWNEENPSKKEITVQNSFKNPLVMVLVLKDSKSIIQPTNYKDAVFQFSAGLPSVSAILLSIGQQDGKPFFAQKEILIGRDTDITLDLKPSTKEEIQAALEKIEAGYAK